MVCALLPQRWWRGQRGGGRRRVAGEQGVESLEARRNGRVEEQKTAQGDGPDAVPHVQRPLQTRGAARGHQCGTLLVVRHRGGGGSRPLWHIGRQAIRTAHRQFGRGHVAVAGFHQAVVVDGGR